MSSWNLDAGRSRSLVCDQWQSSVTHLSRPTCSTIQLFWRCCCFGLRFVNNRFSIFMLLRPMQLYYSRFRNDYCVDEEVVWSVIEYHHVQQSLINLKPWIMMAWMIFVGEMAPNKSNPTSTSTPTTVIAVVVALVVVAVIVVVVIVVVIFVRRRHRLVTTRKLLITSF